MGFVALNPSYSSPLLRHAQPARHGAAADVIDAGVDDALALDLDQHRLAELAAVELAHDQREVGALGIPGDPEFRSKLNLCGPLRAADGNTPAPLVGRRLHGFGELGPQRLRGLLEGEAPVVEHVTVIDGTNTPSDDVEMRVLIGMQLHHFSDGQEQTNEEHDSREYSRQPPDALQ